MNQRQSLCVFILSAFISTAISPCAFALEVFDFIVTDERGESSVFATLELAKLPATLEDFVNLSFSPAAEEMFGFGSVYAGTFDGLLPDTFPQFKLDISGTGLTGTNADAVNGVVMRDYAEIPSNSLPNLTSVRLFDVRASTIVGVRDKFLLRYFDFDGNDVLVIQTGDFIQVPEPRATAWFVPAVAAWLALRRRSSEGRLKSIRCRALAQQI